MIKLYRSNYDEFDPDNNGGDITDFEIESGVKNSFLLRVRPHQAEFGAVRWFKFYVYSDIDIITIGVDLAVPTTSPKEEVYIGLDSGNYESDVDKDNFRSYGGFFVTDVDSDNIKITADRDVSDFVKADDVVTFYDTDLNRIIALEVDSVDSDKITFKKWGNKEVKVGFSGCSTLYIDSIDKDTPQAIWLKQVIPDYTDAMEDPLDEFRLNIWYDPK